MLLNLFACMLKTERTLAREIEPVDMQPPEARLKCVSLCPTHTLCKFYSRQSIKRLVRRPDDHHTDSVGVGHWENVIGTFSTGGLLKVDTTKTLNPCLAAVVILGDLRLG